MSIFLVHHKKRAPLHTGQSVHLMNVNLPHRACFERIILLLMTRIPPMTILKNRYHFYISRNILCSWNCRMKVTNQMKTVEIGWTHSFHLNHSDIVGSHWTLRQNLRCKSLSQQLLQHLAHNAERSQEIL